MREQPNWHVLTGLSRELVPLRSVCKSLRDLLDVRNNALYDFESEVYKLERALTFLDTLRREHGTKGFALPAVADAVLGEDLSQEDMSHSEL